MGNPSKTKGSGFEREIVRALQDAGLAAVRVPLSGSVGGVFSGDIHMPVLGIDREIECKRRKRSFQWFHEMLGTCWALFARDDQCKPIVIMPADRWIAFVALADQYRSLAETHAPRAAGILKQKLKEVA